ncbi:hypothetical protein B0H16DRAFT_1884802 [Mycena metata]|uniref:Uncharacterized protein n=1 Tax=Mycena metata TaxID=1033252 RepID=A0AAD7NFF9_9AGAR|nr:hypothetical protein B0H16DRAFT_1884802 [Mycena metata]
MPLQYVLRPVPLRNVPAERGHSIPSASPLTYARRTRTPSPPPPHRPDPNLKHALPARICVSCATPSRRAHRIQPADFAYVAQSKGAHVARAFDFDFAAGRGIRRTIYIADRHGGQRWVPLRSLLVSAHDSPMFVRLHPAACRVSEKIIRAPVHNEVHLETMDEIEAGLRLRSRSQVRVYGKKSEWPTTSCADSTALARTFQREPPFVDIGAHFGARYSI